MRCPICSSSTNKTILSIEDTPIFNNILHTSREEAISAEKAQIELRICLDCAVVFNSVFDPQKVAYTDALYENALHFSPKFQNYAESLADSLIRDYGLQHKTIIEAGSGDGYFLKLLCKDNKNKGFGFDPSYRPEIETTPENIRLFSEFLHEETQVPEADLIVSRHTLEHVADPNEFLSTLQPHLADEEKSILFMEVPNATFMFDTYSILDVIYEHHLYFSPPSLRILFERNGLFPQRTESTYEDQFLCIHANQTPGKSREMNDHHKTVSEVIEKAESFREGVNHKIDRWRKFVDRHPKKTVLWGAGSKGVSFLNLPPIAERIDYVVDINPRKHGKFTAGTGAEIIPPERLEAIHPNLILIMNPIYKQEIRTMLEKLGVSCELEVV